jgi:hypothetical protein
MKALTTHLNRGRTTGSRQRERQSYITFGVFFSLFFFFMVFKRLESNEQPDSCSKPDLQGDANFAYAKGVTKQDHMTEST